MATCARRGRGRAAAASSSAARGSNVIFSARARVVVSLSRQNRRCENVRRGGACRSCAIDGIRALSAYHRRGD